MQIVYLMHMSFMLQSLVHNLCIMDVLQTVSNQISIAATVLATMTIVFCSSEMNAKCIDRRRRKAISL